MIEPIEIVSYGPAQSRNLTWQQVCDLRAAAGSRLTITASDTRDRWDVSAGASVGTVAVPGVQVLITPNIAPENLFHMLEAGGRVLDVRPEAFEYSTRRQLLPAMATFFARVVEQAIASGAHRSYETREEALIGLRGRFDVRAQIRSVGLPLPTWCRFDEFTADVQLNRVLRAATRKLMHVPGVAVPTRRALGGILVRLDDVGDVTAPDLARPSIFNRLNRRFEPADRLARIVLGGSTLVDQRGGAAAGTFLVDMPKLFEAFVTERLRRYLAGTLEVVDQKSRVFAAPPAGHPKRAKPTIVPDLEFRRSGRPVYVGDVKYKLAKDNIGRSSDYYQLLAYTTVRGQREGVLVYCQDDGDPPARELIVTNTSTTLWTRSISLNVPPSQVDAQLRSLATWIDQRAAKADIDRVVTGHSTTASS